MCGRYDLSETGRTLRIGDIELVLTTTRPRYNVAPLQMAPVVRRGDEGLWIADLRWGLIPSWARDGSLASRCLNARSETVAEKPVFRAAFRKQRCLVPADGYFEWQRGGPPKLPWRFVRRDRQPLLMAGLWESWRPPEAKEGPDLGTYTILTTAPNGDAAAVHDRMPVLLTPAGAAAWLDPAADRNGLLALCVAPPDGWLERYRVATVVNNSGNDVPDCVARVAVGDG